MSADSATVLPLNRDFQELLEALLAQDAEFLVVGAHALALHGSPRATGDLDIWVRPNAENAGRVWSALVSFGAPLGALDVTQEDLSTPGMVIQVGLPPRRIDILTAISGVEFEDAWAVKIWGGLPGLQIPFLSRKHLVANKKATGRPKDLADLALLESG